MLSGVMPGRAPFVKTAFRPAGSRLDSSILPTAVQWAGSRRPTADHPDGVRAVDLDEVDDIGAVEDGHVYRLVARGGHVPRDALRLADQVKPARERRAELEEGHAEPVPHRLARHGDQVCASHERDEQLVDGGTG
jgi:hypothetical protein